jgi:hypothetical protein
MDEKRGGKAAKGMNKSFVTLPRLYGASHEGLAS